MDDPHVEVEIKPQLKLRSSVAKEEDPKPSRQLYKLHIKSTRSTRQTVVHGIYMRAPTKEHTVVLIAVDIRGKNTGVYSPIRAAF